jgi:hypothetical protein
VYLPEGELANDFRKSLPKENKRETTSRYRAIKKLQEKKKKKKKNTTVPLALKSIKVTITWIKTTTTTLIQMLI